MGCIIQAGETDLEVGAYHFFSFDSAGTTQAQNFINTVGKREGMLTPVIDVEYYADKRENPPDANALRQELQVMLHEIQSYYQVVPVIYATEEVWEGYLEGYFDEYPLWIRNVYRKPGISSPWTFWQYTNRGRLKGYEGDETFIDLNVFSGDEEAWEYWLSGHKVSEEVSESQKGF